MCMSPSTSPPALQLEMLLVAGGANVSFFCKVFPDENVSSEMLLGYNTSIY